MTRLTKRAAVTPVLVSGRGVPLLHQADHARSCPPVPPPDWSGEAKSQSQIVAQAARPFIGQIMPAAAHQCHRLTDAA